MTVTDGNLRLTNQYARFSLDRFRAFLCVHPRLGVNRDNQWFVTERAHQLEQQRLASCNAHSPLRRFLSRSPAFFGFLESSQMRDCDFGHVA